MRKITFIAGMIACLTMLTLVIQSRQVSVTKQVQDRVPEVSRTKSYTSGKLNVSFHYPESYRLREELNDIFLTKTDNEIKISLTGSAGQTTDVDTYMAALETRNSIQFRDKKPFKSHTFSGYRVNSTGSDGSALPMYFLSDNSGIIYTITSSGAELAGDMEPIAGSFRRPGR